MTLPLLTSPTPAALPPSSAFPHFLSRAGWGSGGWSTPCGVLRTTRRRGDAVKTPRLGLAPRVRQGETLYLSDSMKSDKTRNRAVRSFREHGYTCFCLFFSVRPPPTLIAGTPACCRLGNTAPRCLCELPGSVFNSCFKRRFPICFCGIRRAGQQLSGMLI